MTPEFQIKDGKIEILHEPETEVIGLEEAEVQLSNWRTVLARAQQDVINAQEWIDYYEAMNVEAQKEIIKLDVKVAAEVEEVI